jgi:hypothetical protein
MQVCPVLFSGGMGRLPDEGEEPSHLHIIRIYSTSLGALKISELFSEIFNLACTVIIDPTLISFYNTFMISLRRYYAGIFSYWAGFFRPDHDPPAPTLPRVH